MGRHRTVLGNIQPAELGHDRLPHPDTAGVTNRALAYGESTSREKWPSLGSHRGACAGSAMVMRSATQDPGHTSRARTVNVVVSTRVGTPVTAAVWVSRRSLPANFRPFGTVPLMSDHR
jgi:hypothetical protein